MLLWAWWLLRCVFSSFCYLLRLPVKRIGNSACSNLLLQIKRYPVFLEVDHTLMSCDKYSGQVLCHVYIVNMLTSQLDYLWLNQNTERCRSLEWVRLMWGKKIWEKVQMHVNFVHLSSLLFPWLDLLHARLRQTTITIYTFGRGP